MKDLFKGVKGHFKAERLDACDNVIDTPVDDHNMIMTSARTSMAEIFAHLTNVDLSNAFYFGTLGHKEPNIYLPKDSGDGFTKDRDRMFSSVSNKKNSHSGPTFISYPRLAASSRTLLRAYLGSPWNGLPSGL